MTFTDWTNITTWCAVRHKNACTYNIYIKNIKRILKIKLKILPNQYKTNIAAAQYYMYKGMMYPIAIMIP